MADTTLVTIYGRQYRLKSDDQSDITMLAKVVDDRMRELARHADTMQAVDLAILVALQLADDLSKAHVTNGSEPAGTVPAEVAAGIEDLVELVSGVLPDDA